MTLKDLSVSNIERVRRDLWSWSQMDKPLLAPATFVSALQDLVDEGVMARTQMWSLIGGFLADFAGAPTRTRQKYVASARSHGIEPNLGGMREPLAQASSNTYVADYALGEIQVIVH